MIEEIVIRDLGVIGSATLPFGPGLTVLTGETGAGKTMVLNALGLLLGDRSDSSAIRAGQDNAFVEGRWQLNKEIQQRLSESGIELDEPELILSRSVSSEGRSRATLSGRSVPISLLAEVGELLVVVHGQSDQIRLRSQSAQREALDQFAGSELATTLSQYQEVFEQWRTTKSKLTELTEQLENRQREANEIRAAVEELENLDPVAGEDATLAEQAERLTHLEDLRLAASSAHEELSSEGYDEKADALTLIGKARRALESASEHDAELAAIAQQLREIGYSLNETAASLAGYLASLDAEGASELERIQQRRAELAQAMRRFGPTLDEVIAYRESAGKRLLELDSSAGDIASLTDAEQQLFAQAIELADSISKLRAEAASRLAAEVTSELTALAMSGSRLEVSVQSGSDLGPFGRDQVSILLSSYQGAEARPLGKGASGGELSRIMLAIEVVLAQSEMAPTFIFDEVDAGVGGAAAIEVGRRLAQLARTAQVIVVTHLPQVAAFATQHLRVLKNQSGEFTASDVVKLEGEAVVEELARMLSGLSESESGRSHAQELLDRAREFNLG